MYSLYYTVHGILQARYTGVGSLSLLQGIFLTQGLNPGLLHCRRILYQLSHKGSPRILEWVAYPFSSRSSQPRNWIGSPAFQADSLPTELSGNRYNLYKYTLKTPTQVQITQNPMFLIWICTIYLVQKTVKRSFFTQLHLNFSRKWNLCYKILRKESSVLW